MLHLLKTQAAAPERKPAAYHFSHAHNAAPENSAFPYDAEPPPGLHAHAHNNTAPPAFHFVGMDKLSQSHRAAPSAQPTVQSAIATMSIL